MACLLHPPTTGTLTIEEFERLPDDGWRLELFRLLVSELFQR